MHEIEIETVEKSMKDKNQKTYYNVIIFDFINEFTLKSMKKNITCKFKYFSYMLSKCNLSKNISDRRVYLKFYS